MEVAHIFVSGFVQGVGFRHFVKRSAEEIGLKGWVRNLEDNRVEAVFQGSKEQVDKMILLCRKGPFLAEVKDIEVVWEKTGEHFFDFQIMA